MLWNPLTRWAAAKLNGLTSYVPPPPRGDGEPPRRILLVHAHPCDDSLSAALADAVVAGARDGGHELRRHALYAERYPCALTSEERSSYFDVSRGTQRCPPETRRALDDLRWCDSLVLVYPTWWKRPPRPLTPATAGPRPREHAPAGAQVVQHARDAQRLVRQDPRPRPRRRVGLPKARRRVERGARGARAAPHKRQADSRGVHVRAACPHICPRARPQPAPWSPAGMAHRITSRCSLATTVEIRCGHRATCGGPPAHAACACRDVHALAQVATALRAVFDPACTCKWLGLYRMDDAGPQERMSFVEHVRTTIARDF